MIKRRPWRRWGKSEFRMRKVGPGEEWSSWRKVNFLHIMADSILINGYEFDSTWLLQVRRGDEILLSTVESDKI